MSIERQKQILIWIEKEDTQDDYKDLINNLTISEKLATYFIPSEMNLNGECQ
ncbi:hypothetical protein ACIP9C_19565 [Lysinibacillus sp. NPDC093210]|uniref:hypothetical protein n=1 Tax=Lysinibacillus sp. NPDC093210 TaxID=3364133 RepID=UPI0038124571